MPACATIIILMAMQYVQYIGSLLALNISTQCTNYNKCPCKYQYFEHRFNCYIEVQTDCMIGAGSQMHSTLLLSWHCETNTNYAIDETYGYYANNIVRN